MNLKKFWNEAPIFFKYATYAGGIFVAYKAWTKAEEIKKKARIRRELRARGKEIIKFNLPIPVYKDNKWTTIQKEMQVNLVDVAEGIYDAFYNNDWLGLSEDEETAVNELKKVPKQYIKQLADIYMQLYNKNLYNDFRRLLSAEYYKQTVSNLLS